MARSVLTCLGAVALLAGASPLLAAAPTPPRPAAPLPSDRLLDIETVRLWDGRAPGATGDLAEETPTLTVFRVLPGFGNGTAVIVAPGGGYVGVSANLEGRIVADWFASRGITAFLLNYRTGPRARLPIPFADGRRAMQYVRANAARFKVDPARIGMIGFSAGGHLAAMTAAQATEGDPAAADPLDRVGSRPDFLVLAYPWLEGTVVDASGQSQYCMFAQTDCRPADYAQYVPTRFVTDRMPPTFLYHTTTDSLVPAGGSLRFYEALHAARVPVELHVFDHGEHGSAMGGGDPALARWPDLMEHWLRRLRFIR